MIAAKGSGRSALQVTREFCSRLPVARRPSVTLVDSDGLPQNAGRELPTCRYVRADLCGVAPLRWTPDSELGLTGRGPGWGVRRSIQRSSGKKPCALRWCRMNHVLRWRDDSGSTRRRYGTGSPITSRRRLEGRIRWRSRCRSAKNSASFAKEVDELRTEREILRKAAAYFAQETIRSAASGSSTSTETPTASSGSVESLESRVQGSMRGRPGRRRPGRSETQS